VEHCIDNAAKSLTVEPGEHETRHQTCAVADASLIMFQVVAGTAHILQRGEWSTSTKNAIEAIAKRHGRTGMKKEKKKHAPFRGA